MNRYITKNISDYPPSLTRCVDYISRVSLKRLLSDKKIPQIHLSDSAADHLSGRFADQANAFPTREERLKFELLPPLFPEFLIVIDLDGLAQDVIFVHYETPETAFVAYYAGGRRVLCFTNDLTGVSDDEEGTPMMLLHTFSERYLSQGSAHVSETARMVRFCWLSVSRYMLYYSPDLEYIDNAGVPAPPHKPAPGTAKKSASRLEILLRSKKHVYHIPDGAEKAFRSPPQYSKLSWQVRGHYRRMGTKKEWRYVPPTVAHRHDAKKRTPDAPRYRIEEDS